MRYDLKKQEKSDWCFPACLQAILRRYDLYSSQEQIAGELRVEGRGASLENVSFFLKQKGFEFDFCGYNQTPFNEPDSLLKDSLVKGKDILVAMPNSGGYHIFILEDFRDPFLFMRNPNDGLIKSMDIFDLMGKMAKEKWMGGFGLIRKL